jgi:hypothetical protein
MTEADGNLPLSSAMEADISETLHASSLPNSYDLVGYVWINNTAMPSEPRSSNVADEGCFRQDHNNYNAL